MKKLTLAILGTLSAGVYAESIYLEPLYTVGVESAIIESTTNTITTKTVTPIVYEDSLIHAGESIVIDCSNKPKLKQLGNYNTNIPIVIASANSLATSCNNGDIGLFWSKDEYKIKSDDVVKIDDNTFQVEPFNATQNELEKGMVIGATTNGNLTNIEVNKAKYFKKAKFYGTINNRQYLLQTSNNDELFTVHAANLTKLVITDKNGQIISTIDFTQ